MNYDEVLDSIHADMVEAIDRDEWAFIVWGKHWSDCTPHQQSEALRLRGTPFGAGFEPRPEPVDGHLTQQHQQLNEETK